MQVGVGETRTVAGKTTTMRAVFGVVPSTRVAALIYGRSILRTGSRVRLREVLGSQRAA